MYKTLPILYAKVFWLLLLLPLTLTKTEGQRKKQVSINIKRNEIDTSYIKSTYEYLQLRLDVNTITNQINFTNPAPFRDFTLEPNESFKTRLSGAYRWLNLSFSFAPSIGSWNEEGGERGSTDVLGFQLDLNFKSLQQQLFYRQTQGYYQTNTEDYRTDLLLNDIHQTFLLYPDIQTVELGLENYYYFNSTTFSSRFARNQNEIQLKSAGSPIAFLGTYFTDIDGRDQDFTFLDFLPEIEGSYLNRSRNIYAGIGGGYAYNYVFAKHFYATVQATPIAGINLSRSEFSDSRPMQKNTNLTLGFSAEASLGFNYDRWFGGLYFNYSNYDSPNADYRIEGEREFIMAFLGYRLASPKILKRTFEKIENIFSKKK